MHRGQNVLMILENILKLTGFQWKYVAVEKNPVQAYKKICRQSSFHLQQI